MKANFNARCITHTLHTTSSNDLTISELNTLSCKHDRLHATRANFVDRGCVRGGIETSLQGHLSCRRLTNTSLNDITEINFFDQRRVDSAGLKGVFESNRSQLRRSETFERAVEGTDWGAGSGDDDSFVDLKESF